MDHRQRPPPPRVRGSPRRQIATRASVFLESSRAGAWLTWSFSVFWTIRLFFQWFVYPRELWRGKKMETIAHAWLSVLWLSLAVLFAVCGVCQAAWPR